MLIIDDDSATRSVLSEYVAELGLIAMEAENGVAGLARAREARPDLILLDVHMPLMNGQETLALLMQDPSLKSIPVIVVSGLYETDVAAACIEAGAEDYLSKPIAPTLLRARLMSTLERTRLRAREIAHLRQIEEDALQLEERIRAKTRGLAEAHERLRVLDQAKDEFLSLIAHELRTPVTGVFGASEVLRGYDLDEAGRALAMDLLHTSIERLLRIVEDALLLTRIKVSTEGPELDGHPLAPIWASAAEQASGVAATRGVLIAQPDGRGSVLCEATLLAQGLSALLECALKFSAPGETLRTTCTTVGESLHVRIEATGHRIPVEAIPRFFDLLSLAKPITPGGDLGLGPAVAARILHVLGGSVAVIATDDGTAFVVTLKSAPAAPKNSGCG